jgi:hypothetical protein
MTPRDVVPLSQHLSIEFGSDGVYLTFDTLDGRSAILRVESLAMERPGMNSEVLLAWCRERRREREIEIEASAFDLNKRSKRSSR